MAKGALKWDESQCSPAWKTGTIWDKAAGKGSWNPVSM